MQAKTDWGLIAGNGRFPFLVLEGARSQGIEMAVIALKRRSFAGTGASGEAVALGKPGRIEPSDRVAASAKE